MSDRCAEQEVWRAVHSSGSAQCLDETQIAQLRLWAAGRMRDMSFVVFDPVKGTMRPSFGNALSLTALVIAEGHVPE